MLSLSRPIAIAIVCAALAACGSAEHNAPAAAQPAARAPASVASAPAPSAVEGAPVAADAVTKNETPTDGESVSPATFSISPIARALAATAPAAAPAIPSRWVENKNYTTLVPAQPVASAPDKVEVVEVFWYGCPHCYHLDPLIDVWLAQSKPAYVDFVRMPVIWPGDPVKLAHARLYYTIEALGKVKALHAEAFREIHINQNPLYDPDPAKTEVLQKAFLTAHGVSAAEFDRTYHSFSVNTSLQRAEQYTSRYRVTGVPTMVVAGKYTTDAAAAGGEGDLFTLVNDLAASEHKR